IPNSDPTPVEPKTEKSPAIEAKNPTISEIPNSDPKTENSPATQTKNPTVSEIPNSDPTPVEPKTDSLSVETKNSSVSEIPNSDPNPENYPAIETKNSKISDNIIPTISENTQLAIPFVNSIDFITGDKIEIPVFIQQDKPEIPASTTSTDILTGEMENSYPILIDIAETESSQNHQPSASEYIVTDTQTIIPEIAVTENQHLQQSENIITDSDNQPPTTIDEYLNPDFDSEKTTITPAISSDENNQPENSQNIITDSNTNINEYAITNTETQPLIGIIDTGFIANNPNIDYSQIILGKDVIDNDNNPLLQPNEGNQHGDTILEIISPSNNQNNSKKAPTIWLARATGSSN
ncbi:hypothetical protein, partial [Microcoleus sp. herbarium14]|uniref:hypothetical protein n=1 Tax=Microcoleus sp. herbarium14 TaxID=3055439 RepID=UPI002FCFDEB6